MSRLSLQNTIRGNLPVRGVAALASVAHQAVSKVTKLLLSFSWSTHPHSMPLCRKLTENGC